MIDVFDGVMGSGKSLSIIKDVKEGSVNFNRYIVIVPSLDEVERYVNACDGLLVEPCEKPTKSMHLLKLVGEGRSIITTHKLFEMWTEDIADIVEEQKYHIIIDEETDCLTSFGIKKGIEKELRRLNLLIDTEEFGVGWNVADEGLNYDTNVDHMAIRKTCMKYSVHKFGSDMIIQYPSHFFKRTNRYSIYTYRFIHSYMRAYFDYNDIKYNIRQLICEADFKKKMETFRGLITIVTPKTKFFDDCGNGTNYSHSWWSDRDEKELNQLRSNIGMYMKRCGFDKDKTLYCCPKSLSGELKGHGHLHVAPRGYKGLFLPYNAKATNKYIHIENLAYLMNVFPNVNIYRYANARLAAKGMETLNKDEIALSTLLQCVWRSAIRDGKPIKVLLLSNRMEKLFIDWLNN